MKLFVWDFHGVLEKGNDGAVVEITNIALEKHGYLRRMTMEEGELLAGLRWYEYISYLLPNQEHELYLSLQATCFEISKNRPDIVAKYISLNDNATEVLEAIRNSNHHQILISNTPPTALDSFVSMVGIEEYFPSSHRFGVDTHTQQQSTKVDCLRAYLQDKHFPDGIISIGDSQGDMNLIKLHSKSKGYLYSHPGRTHRTADCHYQINDLREVMKEICKST